MNKFNPSYVGLRKDLLKYISGENNKILDVGCANGVNGCFLIKNNFAAKVYGIEYNIRMAKEAEKRINKVFQGDLNDDNFISEILDNSPLYDYIIFGDILEHLYNPFETLKKLKTSLRNDGQIIISVPNIAHIETFIQIYLNGTWPQNQRGIFDKTHIRWFTKKDLYQLVEKSGLKVINYEPKIRARDAQGSRFSWKYSILKRINKRWFTFQHIIVCVHDK